MTRPLNILLGCLITVLSLGKCEGQALNFRKYTADDGLASSLVYRCMQDSRGFMWFGTDGGVSRFDGYSFDNFTAETGLGDNEVFDIHEDSKGRIWFMTFNGRLSYFQDGEMHNDFTDAFLKKAALEASAASFFEDSQGNIWIGSFNGSITRISGEQVFRYAIGNDLTVANFTEDAQGRLYCFKGKQRMEYDVESDRFTNGVSCPDVLKDTFFHIGKNKAIYNTPQGIATIEDGIVLGVTGPSVPSVLHISKASDDEVFLCSRAAGVLKKNLKTGETQKVIREEAIHFTMYDLEGNQWFCTREYGVWMIPAGQLDVRVWNEGTGMEKTAVYDIIADTEGQIWMACNDNMVYKCRDSLLMPYHLPQLNNIQGRVLGLAETTHGNLVASGDAGLYLYQKTQDQFQHLSLSSLGQLRPSAGTKQLLAGKSNDVWTGGAGGMTHLSLDSPSPVAYIDSSFIFRRRVILPFIDSKARNWISTEAGLEIYATGTARDKGIVVLRDRVIAMTETTDGSMVCATEGPGLILLYHDTPTDTLVISDEVGSGIFRDVFSRGDTVWAAGNNGVARMIVENGKIKTSTLLTRADGLLSAKARSVFVRDNLLYVGTDRGISIIPLHEYETLDPVPELYIRSISGTWGRVLKNQLVNLDYLNNNITIEFAAITFLSPEDVVYEYKLDNSKDWVKSTGRTIALSNLTYHEHSLQLRARIGDGSWSTVISAHFSITPPFWKTKFFYVVSGLLVASLLAFFVSLRYTRMIRRVNEISIINSERNRISADLHDDIGADLSKIVVSSELLRNEDSHQLNPHVMKILDSARNLRGKADDIIWALNPANNSVGNMTSYLRKLGTDFFEGTGIRFIQKESELEEDHQFSSLERRNLFLMAKEIFNNALKHSGATEVILNVSKTGKLFIVTIEDNGTGFEFNEVTWRNGGKTTRQRAEEIRAVVEWHRGISGGTLVVIKLEAGKRHQMKV